MRNDGMLGMVACAELQLSGFKQSHMLSITNTLLPLALPDTLLFSNVEPRKWEGAVVVFGNKLCGLQNGGLCVSLKTC